MNFHHIASRCRQQALIRLGGKNKREEQQKEVVAMKYDEIMVSI